MDELNLQDFTNNDLIEIILLQNKPHEELVKIIDESKKDIIEDKPKKDVIEDKPKKDIIEDKLKKDIIEDKPKKDIIEDESNITQIKETDRALKGYTKSYEINIINKKNPLEQLQNTRLTLKNHLETLLNEFCQGNKHNFNLQIRFCFSETTTTWKLQK